MNLKTSKKKEHHSPKSISFLFALLKGLSVSTVSNNHLKSSEINSSFGKITLDKAFKVSHEYRKFGNVRASTLIDSTRPSSKKKHFSKTRSAISLDDFREFKRDINYIVSELSTISSCRNKNIRYDSKLIKYTTDVSNKINYCLQNLYVDPDTNEISSLGRCKNHACPYCNYVKQSTRQSEFKAGLRTVDMNDIEYKYTSFITISFVDKARTYREVTEQIKSLNKAISKILGYRKFRNIITGSVRSIETIETLKTKEAHVHLHMLALVNRFKVITKKELRSLIEALTGQRVRVHIENKLRPSNNEQAKELLSSCFNYMHKTFGLKTDDRFSNSKLYGDFSSSSVRRQSVDFYLIMLRGIKGQRLYNSTGFFRKVLKEGKIELNARKPKSKRISDEKFNRLIPLYWYKKPTFIQNHNVVYDLGYYMIDKNALNAFTDELDSNTKIQPRVQTTAKLA
jgi:hypothetical protein